MPPEPNPTRQHTITLRCQPGQKGTYVAAARAAGQSLETWALAALDAAVPAETHQLVESKRRAAATPHLQP